MSANDEIHLKPCPFCGGEAEFTSGYYNDLSIARVDCMNCPATMYIDSDHFPRATMDELEKSVLEDWNRRATDGVQSAS